MEPRSICCLGLSRAVLLDGSVARDRRRTILSWHRRKKTIRIAQERSWAILGTMVMVQALGARLPITSLIGGGLSRGLGFRYILFLGVVGAFLLGFDFVLCSLSFSRAWMGYACARVFLPCPFPLPAYSPFGHHLVIFPVLSFPPCASGYSFTRKIY